VEFQIIVKSLYEKIVFLTYLNCQGCQEFYSSFKNDFCYITNWDTLVDIFLDKAIQEFPDASNFPKRELYEAICDYGTSDDRETLKFN
jgi:hypothetical protein